MADTLGTSTDGASSFAATDVSFDACSEDGCSETGDAAVVTPGGGFASPVVSFALLPAPEPETFVLVGKRRR